VILREIEQKGNVGTKATDELELWGADFSNNQGIRRSF
jgi:hypothetical protein